MLINGEKSNATPSLSFSVINVPIVSQYAYAGYLTGYADDEYIDTLPTIPYLDDREGYANYMAFEVHGDSMDDGSTDAYTEGEKVICREVDPLLWKDSKLNINKRDYVIVHSEGIIIKKITKHDVERHTIVVHSLNPEYADKEIDLAEVRKLFSIIASVKSRRL